jgi:hypothetical protein
MSCRVEDHLKVWDRVLPGMIRLYNQDPIQDWTIDDVRSQLDRGRALLVIDDTEPSAFAVICLDESPYKSVAQPSAPKELELFLELACHPGGNAFVRFQPRLEDIARCAGAKCIRFYSRRPGMARLAATVGYVPRSVEFVKEV